MSEGNFEIKKSHTEPENPQKDEKIFKNELADAIKKMNDQLRETGKNILEVIPQDRNFDIELQESKSGINLRLKQKKDGVEKDLNTFLPPEHFFEKDKIFVYKDQRKENWFSGK